MVLQIVNCKIIAELAVRLLCKTPSSTTRCRQSKCIVSSQCQQCDNAILLLFDAGFGSVATVPWLLFSFFHSEALMAMAFPLFALTACVSDPLAHYNQGKPPPFCSLQLQAGCVSSWEKQSRDCNFAVLCFFL